MTVSMISMTTASKMTQTAPVQVQATSVSAAKQACGSSHTIGLDHQKSKEELSKQPTASNCQIGEVERGREVKQPPISQSQSTQFNCNSDFNQEFPHSSPPPNSPLIEVDVLSSAQTLPIAATSNKRII